MTAERAGAAAAEAPKVARTRAEPTGADSTRAESRAEAPSESLTESQAGSPSRSRTGSQAEEETRATEAAGDEDGVAGRWAPGTRILWRYRANGTGLPHICRPVTVVRDTPELLAAWVAPGTVCVKPEIADGTPVHHEPLATRYTKPRRTVLSRWFGTGVLKLARPGEPWSVWLFWERDWQFKNWYVNLEEPRHRWAGGIDSEDHFLDIAVYPDRSWEWRDEDEFAAARSAGLVDDELAARVRAAGRAVVEQIDSWASPFRDGWEHWRPDPHWPVPSLPQDWDGRPPPGAARPYGRTNSTAEGTANGRTAKDTAADDEPANCGAADGEPASCGSGGSGSGSGSETHDETYAAGNRHLGDEAADGRPQDERRLP